MKKMLYGFLMCVISLSVITPACFADDDDTNMNISELLTDKEFCITGTVDKTKDTYVCSEDIKDNIDPDELDEYISDNDIKIQYFKVGECFALDDQRVCKSKSDATLQTIALCSIDNRADGKDSDDRVCGDKYETKTGEIISVSADNTNNPNQNIDSIGTITGKAAETLTDKADDDNMKGKEIGYNILSGVSTAAMGIGAMEAAQALSEQKQDAAAERDMAAYLATMRCETAKGKSYKLSDDNIELDGGSELIKYVSEYKKLAAHQKNIKTALNMKPGIESEEILSKADAGLYEYTPADKAKSKFGSLANALRDENSEDAQKWAEDKEKTQKHLVVGASVAAAGLVTAVATNLSFGKKIREETSYTEQDNNGVGDARIFGNEN